MDGMTPGGAAQAASPSGEACLPHTGRVTATSRDVRGGCFTCHGSDAHWWGAQAQGTAARHHDATGHPTWADVVMSVRYGRDTPDPAQLDIEGAIAAAPPVSRLA